MKLHLADRSKSILLGCVLATLPLFGLSEPNWEKIIGSGDPEKLVAVIRDQGAAFRIDAALFGRLCDRPELMQAVLDYLQGESQVAVSEPLPKADLSKKLVRTEPVSKPVPVPEREARSAVAVGRTVRDLLDDLRVSERLSGTAGESKRLASREFLARIIMETGSETGLSDLPEKDVPEWVRNLSSLASKAKFNGYPTLKFAIRRVAFSGPERENGVKVYAGLFMVSHTPQDVEFFKLEEAFILSHEDFPVKYQPDNKSFEMNLLGKPGRKVIPLGKILNKRDALELFPGKWGFRLMHTTGQDDLRSDQTFYFQVEPGKNYELALDDRDDRLNFELREIDPEP